MISRMSVAVVFMAPVIIIAAQRWIDANLFIIAEPNWESRAGLVFNINCTTIPPATQNLRDRFTTTPLFRDVVDALEGIQSGLGLRERKRARHRAMRYMIEDGKLWYVGGGTSMQAVVKRECVTKEEAVEIARLEHEKGGHFH